MKLILTLFALALFMPAPVHAADGIDMRALRDFCKDDDRTLPPAPGKQFSGGSADADVMTFRPGEYKLDDKGSALSLHADGSYVLTLGLSYNPVFGSDGDDMMKGKILGGCSREQLSEVLGKNKILEIARQAVPVDPALKSAAEAAAAEKEKAE